MQQSEKHRVIGLCDSIRQDMLPSSDFSRRKLEWSEHEREKIKRYNNLIRHMQLGIEAKTVELDSLTSKWRGQRHKDIVLTKDDYNSDDASAFILETQCGDAARWMRLVPFSMPVFAIGDAVSGLELDKLVDAWRETTGSRLAASGTSSTLSDAQFSTIPVLPTEDTSPAPASETPLISRALVQQIVSKIDTLQRLRTTAQQENKTAARLVKCANAATTSATSNDARVSLLELHIQRTHLTAQRIETRMQMIQNVQELWYAFHLARTNVLNAVANLNLMRINRHIEHFVVLNSPTVYDDQHRQLQKLRQTLIELKQLHAKQSESARAHLYETLHQLQQLQSLVLVRSDQLVAAQQRYQAELRVATDAVLKHEADVAWPELLLHFVHDLYELEVFRLDRDGTSLPAATSPRTCTTKLAHHDRIRADLLSPRVKKYRGMAILDNSDESDGVESVGAVLQCWLEEAGFETEDPSDRQVLILLPCERVLLSHIDGLHRVFPSTTHDLSVVRGGNHGGLTVRMSLCQKETWHMLRDGKSGALVEDRNRAPATVNISEPLSIVLHCFTAPLPDSLQRLYGETLRQPEPFELPVVTYRNSLGVYDALKYGDADEQIMLQLLEQDRISTERVIRDRRGSVGVPQHGLVLVQQAHLLLNGGDCGTSTHPVTSTARSSYTCLTWVRCLREARKIKLRLQTSMPAQDSEHAMDLVRLLSLLKDPQALDHQIPCGILRRVLAHPSTSDIPLMRAFHRARLLEQEFLEAHFNTQINAKSLHATLDWDPLRKREFQTHYAGLIAHTDLSGCSFVDHPVKPLRWYTKNNTTQQFELHVTSQTDTSPASSSTWQWFLSANQINVPELAPFVPDEYDKSIETEMTQPRGKLALLSTAIPSRDGWHHLQTVEALVPVSARRFQESRNQWHSDTTQLVMTKDEKRKRTQENKFPELDNRELTAVAPVDAAKFQALEVLLKASPSKKIAAFSNTARTPGFRTLAYDWAARAGYEVWDMRRILMWVEALFLHKVHHDQVRHLSRNELCGYVVAQWMYEHDSVRRRHVNLSPTMIYLGRVTNQSVHMTDALPRLRIVHKDLHEKRLFDILVAIFNHTDNAKATYAQLMVADSKLPLGVQLSDVSTLIFMEPPSSEMMLRQLATRVVAACSNRTGNNKSSLSQPTFRMVILLSTQRLQTTYDPSGEPVVHMRIEEFAYRRIDCAKKHKLNMLEFLLEACYEVALDRVLLSRRSGTKRVQKPVMSPIPSLGRFAMSLTRDDYSGEDTVLDLGNLSIQYKRDMAGNGLIVRLTKMAALEQLQDSCNKHHGQLYVGGEMTVAQGVALRFVDTKASEAVEQHRNLWLKYSEFLDQVRRTHADGVDVKSVIAEPGTPTHQIILSSFTNPHASRHQYDSNEGVTHELVMGAARHALSGASTTEILPHALTTHVDDWEMFAVLLRLIQGTVDMELADVLLLVDRLTTQQREALRVFLQIKQDQLTGVPKAQLPVLVTSALQMFSLRIDLCEARLRVHQAIHQSDEDDSASLEEEQREAQVHAQAHMERSETTAVRRATRAQPGDKNRTTLRHLQHSPSR